MTGINENTIRLHDDANAIDVVATNDELRATISHVTDAERSPLEATARWIGDAWRAVQWDFRGDVLVISSTGPATRGDASIALATLQSVRAAASPFQALGECAARGWQATTPQVAAAGPPSFEVIGGDEPTGDEPAASNSAPPGVAFESIGEPPALDMPHVRDEGTFALTIDSLGSEPERSTALLRQVLSPTTLPDDLLAPVELGSGLRARDVRRIMVAVGVGTDATFTWTPAP